MSLYKNMHKKCSFRAGHSNKFVTTTLNILNKKKILFVYQKPLRIHNMRTNIQKMIL